MDLPAPAGNGNKPFQEREQTMNRYIVKPAEAGTNSFNVIDTHRENLDGEPYVEIPLENEMNAIRCAECLNAGRAPYDWKISDQHDGRSFYTADEISKKWLFDWLMGEIRRENNQTGPIDGRPIYNSKSDLVEKCIETWKLDNQQRQATRFISQLADIAIELLEVGGNSNDWHKWRAGLVEYESLPETFDRLRPDRTAISSFMRDHVSEFVELGDPSKIDRPALIRFTARRFGISADKNRALLEQTAFVIERLRNKSALFEPAENWPAGVFFYYSGIPHDTDTLPAILKTNTGDEIGFGDVIRETSGVFELKQYVGGVDGQRVICWPAEMVSFEAGRIPPGTIDSRYCENIAELLELVGYKIPVEDVSKWTAAERLEMFSYSIRHLSYYLEPDLSGVDIAPVPEKLWNYKFEPLARIPAPAGPAETLAAPAAKRPAGKLEIYHFMRDYKKKFINYAGEIEVENLAAAAIEQFRPINAAAADDIHKMAAFIELVHFGYIEGENLPAHLSDWPPMLRFIWRGIRNLD